MARSAKAALVIVLDIGYSDTLSVQEQLYFQEKSLECVSMIIQRKIFSSPKDEVGVILMGSEDSNNLLYDGESYRNINVALPLQVASWESVRKLKTISYKTNETANWLEALVVALDLLKKESDSKKLSEKKIVLFTGNFEDESQDKVSVIKEELKDLEAELIVIHPDIDDSSTYALAEGIVPEVDGSLFGLEQALPTLMSFQKKKISPQPWNVCLDIGSKIKIAVTGYKKMNDAQTLKWSTCTISGKEHNGAVNSGPVCVSEKDLGAVIVPPTPSTSKPVNISDRETDAAVQREVTYQGPNQKLVEKDHLVDSYNFGSTLVPFAEEDKQQLSYDSGPKCLSLLKITKAVLVPRHLWMGNSGLYFVARSGDQDATIAFSALVHALDRLKSVAIVRRVYSNGRGRPVVGALIPVIKPSKEFLLYVELPFAHDLRFCIRPDLNVKNLKEEQLNIIDRLIDEMDLCMDVTESEGLLAWSDLLKPHQTLDPYLQHVRRCISIRALNPEAPLPEPDENILKVLSDPPSEIKHSVSDTIKELSVLFPDLIAEEVTKSKTGDKRNIADVDSKDAENGDALKRLKKEQDSQLPYKCVEMISPLEDFKAAIEQEKISFSEACAQMQDVIINLVLNSFGKEDFAKPRDALELLRSNVINTRKADHIVSFNNWMEVFYNQLQEKFKMGFWNLVTEGNLGFITSEECPESTLSKIDMKKILGEEDSSLQNNFEDEDMEFAGLLDEM